MAAGVCFIVAALAGAVVWAWFSAGADSFAVDGVPFREWLSQKPDFAVQDPLARIGTNAVPHLIAILRQRPEPAWAFSLKQSIWSHLPSTLKARFPYLRPTPDWQLRRTALFGVRFFGTEASAALPEVLRIAQTETNRMVRGGALLAALNLAPQSPAVFELWRTEWEHTNHFSRHDLALYLHEPQVPVPGAVPFLVRELTNGNSAARQPVIQAFGSFGDAARPALPQLIEVFENDKHSRIDLLQVFQRLGPMAGEAVPALTASLQKQEPVTVAAFSEVSQTQVQYDETPGLTAETVRALQAIGPAGRTVLPVIDGFLTNSDPTMRLLAAAAHLRVGGSTQEAMPILLAGLRNELHGVSKVYLHVEGLHNTVVQGSQAAIVLCGELGETAAEALPFLERQLDNKNAWTRIIAAQAIWRITHDTSKSLPALIATLDSVPAPGPQGSLPQDTELVRALDAIAEMGPAAKAALPSIERVRTFSMSVRHAANKTIAAFQQTK